MKKIIDIDENGVVLGPPDYETKYNELRKRLQTELFDNATVSVDVQTYGKFKKFGGGQTQVTTDISAMSVTSRLNRYLRMFRPLTLDEAKAIEDREYLNGFGYYCDLITFINDNHVVYIPDKQTFCAFVNITTDIYNELLNDPNYSQVFHSIEDSFVQSNFSSAQAGIVNTSATLAKLQIKDAGHSLVKNPESITINQFNGVDKAQVNKKLEQFASMIKGIEQKKK